MLPEIDPKQEAEKITTFIQQTLQRSGFSKVVLGLSGGIDSSTALTLAVKAVGAENVFAFLLPYQNLNQQGIQSAKDVLQFVVLPEGQQEVFDISPIVASAVKTLGLTIEQSTNEERLRFGNIMARVRMITLFDRAKKLQALVLGTENRSEYQLGYFTRFGDEASDIEPLRHLYKTHIYTLAQYLQIPEHVISQAPSAGLWQQQTDEGEFGFSYKEADPVLYLYYDKKIQLVDIVGKGFINAENVIQWAEQNRYKHQVPYAISV